VGPAPAVAAVRSAVRAVLSSHPVVLVACSGGADSLALAAAVAFEAPRAGVRAGLVTVDHGLQAGSSVIAARVAALGYELGFDPVKIVPVTVGTSGGLEAAARAARYEALDAAAFALDAAVLLGHTLDDQAETVLLGLGRGSGPRSVAGMRVVDGRYLRPLLGLRRSVTAAACAALGLEPWDDPHNTDPAFQRARIRGEVLPLLEDVLQGGVVEALARTATLLQDDLDALDAWAAASSPVINSPVATPEGGHGRVDHSDAGREGAVGHADPSATPSWLINSGTPAKSGGSTRVDHRDEPAAGRPTPSPVINSPVATPEGGHGRVDHREGEEGDGGTTAVLDVAGLAELPRAVRSRVLRAWASAAGADPLTAERTAALESLVTAWRGQAPIQLSGGVSVRRVSGRLVLESGAGERAQSIGEP